MRESPDFADIRSAWLSQPEDRVPVDVERMHSRRTRELSSATRWEIVSSIGAALFFASVMAWRFAGEGGRLLWLGCGAAAVWAALTAFRYRNLIRPSAPKPDDLARTGLEHYRAELSRRRDHLRSTWIWHGPLLLACVVSIAGLAGRVVPGRISNALPVFLLLVAWAAIGIRRRLREAAEVQSRIDEVTAESQAADQP